LKSWGALGLAMQLSWTLLFSLLIPLLVGLWLDKKLDSTPLFILIGAGVGVLAATVGVARTVLRMFPQPEKPVSDDKPTDAKGVSPPMMWLWSQTGRSRSTCGSPRLSTKSTRT